MSRLVRGLVSVALLGGLVLLLDPAALVERLASLDAAWVAVALALSILQVALSAWRWRFTAGRLGIRLPMGWAVSEYYLALFLNQVLPGGVTGDVSRAWRHARTPDTSASGGGGGGGGGAVGGRGEGGTVPPRRHRRRAIHAVVLERTSGQVVVLWVAAVSAVGWVGPRGGAAGWTLLAAGAAAAALAGGVLVRVGLRPAYRRTFLGRIGRDAWRALLGPGALPIQIVTSALVVASYLLTFLAAARAVGLTTPAGVILPLVAPVLVSMLLPVSVAGWGVREGAAAALWGVVGLAPADGMAASVAYGLLVLVSSLPGALVLLRSAAGQTAGAPHPADPPASAVGVRARAPQIKVEEDVRPQAEVAASGPQGLVEPRHGWEGQGRTP